MAEGNDEQEVIKFGVSGRANLYPVAKEVTISYINNLRYIHGGFNKKKFPRPPGVRITNFNGRVLVRVSCVTECPPYHPHYYGVALKQDDHDGYISKAENINDTGNIWFPKLSIVKYTNSDVDSLALRKRDKIDPRNAGFVSKEHISDNFRLAFEVFIMGNYKEISIGPALLSDIIKNKKKNPSLEIFELDPMTSCVQCSRTVFMTCKKIPNGKDVCIEISNTETGQVFKHIKIEKHSKNSLTFKMPTLQPEEHAQLPYKVKLSLVSLKSGDPKEKSERDFYYIMHNPGDCERYKRESLETGCCEHYRRESLKTVVTTRQSTSGCNHSNFGNPCVYFSEQPEPLLRFRYKSENKLPDLTQATVKVINMIGNVHLKARAVGHITHQPHPFKLFKCNNNGFLEKNEVITGEDSNTISLSDIGFLNSSVSHSKKSDIPKRRPKITSAHFENCDLKRVQLEVIVTHKNDSEQTTEWYTCYSNTITDKKYDLPLKILHMSRYSCQMGKKEEILIIFCQDYTYGINVRFSDSHGWTQTCKCYTSEQYTSEQYTGAISIIIPEYPVSDIYDDVIVKVQLYSNDEVSVPHMFTYRCSDRNAATAKKKKASIYSTILNSKSEKSLDSNPDIFSQHAEFSEHKSFYSTTKPEESNLNVSNVDVSFSCTPILSPVDSEITNVISVFSPSNMLEEFNSNSIANSSDNPNPSPLGSAITGDDPMLSVRNMPEESNSNSVSNNHFSFSDIPSRDDPNLSSYSTWHQPEEFIATNLDQLLQFF